jgi:aspartyl-tRNA(Asn)/glutamyl-tRNA(Gln) amidotransferase subunit B
MNRTEHKNVNSFTAIGRLIDFEYKRQLKVVQAGGEVDQETRGWDDESGTSTVQRSKEDAMDYRYFPEPDLLPLNLTDEFVSQVEKLKVELPITRRLRYLNEYKL